MITVKAARAMNIEAHDVRIGSPADLVVLRAPNVLEALREHAAPLQVISHGKLVDRGLMEAIDQTGEWQ